MSTYYSAIMFREILICVSVEALDIMMDIHIHVQIFFFAPGHVLDCFGFVCPAQILFTIFLFQVFFSIEIVISIIFNGAGLSLDKHYIFLLNTKYTQWRPS